MMGRERTCRRLLMLLVSGSLVVTGAAGCVRQGGHSSRSLVKGSTSVVVQDSHAVRLTAPGGSVTLTADPGVVPPGRLTMRQAPEVPVPKGSAPAIAIEAAGDLRGLVRLRFPLPAGTDQTAGVITWDGAGHKWLPVEATRDGDALLVDTPHLSVWSSRLACLRLGDPDNPCELFLNKLLGARADPPHCAAKAWPSWVAGSNTENNSSAQQLYACLDHDGDDLTVRAVNNRGYAVSLVLDGPAGTGRPKVDWPGGLDAVIAQIFAVPEDDRHLLLPPTGEAQLRYSRPVRNGQILGHVGMTAQSLLAWVIAEAIDDVDPDTALGNGTTLGAATVNCALGLIRSAADEFSPEARPSSASAGVIEAVLGCLDDAVDKELKRLAHTGGAVAGLSKVHWALWWFQAVKYVRQAADRFLDGTLDIRESPDISVDVVLGPVIVAADHVGPFRLGMTVDQVRAAADVPLDHDGYCGFYTFHGSASFGVGDGPTFFFDPNGRLGGMIVGRSVFQRAVQTDQGTKFGAMLTDLQATYKDRLQPPGTAEPPNLAIVDGTGTTALGFDLDQDNRIAAFRVGSHSFVNQQEYCG